MDILENLRKHPVCTKAVVRQCATKQTLPKILKNSHENICARFAFYYCSLHKKCSFPLRICSVNVTKSAGIGSGIFLWIFQNFKDIFTEHLQETASVLSLTVICLANVSFLYVARYIFPWSSRLYRNTIFHPVPVVWFIISSVKIEIIRYSPIIPKPLSFGV